MALLRSQPSLDAAGIAALLGTTRGAIAVVLSSLSAKGEIIGRGYLLRDQAAAVVIGGAAWDIKAHSRAAARLHTSNPSTVVQTPGGVGRNIAEGIARLGDRVWLIAAVGADSAGRELLARTAEAGVYVDHVQTSSQPTSSYLAALDEDGELVIGMADFAATDALDPDVLSRSPEVISRSEVAVLDGNLPASVLEWALAVAGAAGVRTVVEPVSVAKASRLSGLLNGQRRVFTITPNVDELAALVGHPVPDNDAAVVAAAQELHARGVEYVWVSRGAAGSLLVGPQEAVTIPAEPVEVVDVTGAGDAMTAGYVHALLSGEPAATAARWGHVAAALTLASPQTVRSDLGVAFSARLHAEGANR